MPAIIRNPRHEDIVIGANIRRLRKLRGMSQEKLGKALEITFQQIQKYEKGTNRVGGSRMVALSRVLACRIDDLFAGLTGEGAEIVQPPPLSDAALDIARAFEDLPPSQRRAFRNLLTSIVGHEAPTLVAAE